MALTDEEQRRLLALEQERVRPINDRARRASLAGDPAAKRELDYRWAPLLDWMKENDR